MVAAGSVVTRDVRRLRDCRGRPARRVGWAGRAANRWRREMGPWTCPDTGERFFGVRRAFCSQKGPQPPSAWRRRPSILHHVVCDGQGAGPPRRHDIEQVRGVLVSAHDEVHLQPTARDGPHLCAHARLALHRKSAGSSDGTRPGPASPDGAAGTWAPRRGQAPARRGAGSQEARVAAQGGRISGPAVGQPAVILPPQRGDGGGTDLHPPEAVTVRCTPRNGFCGSGTG